jgi:hypothetical protein
MKKNISVKTWSIIVALGGFLFGLTPSFGQTSDKGHEFSNKTIPMDSIVQSKLGKWWTSDDLMAIKEGNLGSLLHPFNFTRNSPDEQPIYIGTGVFGGYIDGLGSNSDTYAKNKGLHYQDDIYGLRMGFQTTSLFSPQASPFSPQEGNQVKARSYNPRLVVQPLIEENFNPEFISNYKQTESLWNAEVVTEFDYLLLHIKITSVASWARPYLIFFHSEITNNGSQPTLVQLRKFVSDSLSFGPCEGKMFVLDKLEDVRIAVMDTYYSRMKAVCNKTSAVVKLEPGATMEDVSYFSITTDRDKDDSELVVKEAMQLGYSFLHKEHINAAHERWQKSIILIPDWYLQQLYFQAFYMAIGNTGGEYPIMGASMLGGSGYSGTSYVYDSYMAYCYLLRSGHHDRFEKIFQKILNDISLSNTKFVGFSFDDNPTVGSGRYNYERHECATAPMLFYLMLQYGRLTNNDTFIKDQLYPVMKDVCVYFTKSLKLVDGQYQKDGEYEFEGKTFILRSIESDRRRRWFTDLAISFNYLLLETVELGRTFVNDTDHETLDQLEAIANKIYIPQNEDYYQMFAGDNFPNTPADGWGKKQWNFHTACVGAYPFGNLLDDPKCSRSVQYPYYEGRSGWALEGGGYPVITHFAAARLGLVDFLERLLYDTTAVAYSNKLNVHTGNSIQDNSNFLMAHTAFGSLIQEMVLNVHDSIIRPFPSVIPLFEKHGVYFANLSAYHGIRVNGEYDQENFRLELESPIDQQVSVELPYGIASVRILDHNGKNVNFKTRIAASKRNDTPIELVIVDFKLKKNNIYQIAK